MRIFTISFLSFFPMFCHFRFELRLDIFWFFLKQIVLKSDLFLKKNPKKQRHPSRLEMSESASGLFPPKLTYERVYWPCSTSGFSCLSNYVNKTLEICRHVKYNMPAAGINWSLWNFRVIKNWRYVCYVNLCRSMSLLPV